MVPASAQSAARRAGFTLVEVVAAVLVLSVGLIALAGSAGYLARALATSAALGTATYQARLAIERVRAAPCAAPTHTVQRVTAAAPLPARIVVRGGSTLVLRTAFSCPR